MAYRSRKGSGRRTSSRRSGGGRRNSSGRARSSMRRGGASRAQTVRIVIEPAHAPTAGSAFAAGLGLGVKPADAPKKSKF